MQRSTFKQLRFALALSLTISLLALALSSSFQAQAAQAFANPAFQNLWNRTDKQVVAGSASRSTLWGLEPNTPGLQEDYVEAPGGKRLVQYFDKSRMEITNPDGDKSSPYYVTNGLIAKELISGQRQEGDNKFTTLAPAEIGVAGDPDDTSGPTYKALSQVLKPAATDDTGILVAASIDREGNTYFDRGDYGKKWQVNNAYFEPNTQHNIAGPFWTYLNQNAQVLDAQGKVVTGKLFDPVFYATGLPITESYWAQVKVAGQVKDVLVQAFERRVLTFTPTNDPAYQVEMGNVGQHYYKWRYGNSQPAPAPVPGLTSFSGKGDKVTPKFNLNKGVARFTLSHTNGRSNFIVELLDSDGKTADLPANAIGNYKGSTFAEVRQTGSYVLTIKADGDWKIDIEDMELLRTAPATPATQPTKGKGDNALKVNFSKTGLTTFKMSHNGKRNFAIIMYDKDGKIEELWANEIGNYNGEKASRVTAGDHYLKVEADGDWTIDVTQ